MKVYTFKKSDFGIWGKAFEMFIKFLLGIANCDVVSPPGESDFKWGSYGHYYDPKSGASVIKYDLKDKLYIKGSSRVIYCTHIAYDVINEFTDEEGTAFITISVDLANTSFYIVDRNEFVEFLLSQKNFVRQTARNQINIQTVYNYKADNYHGKKGRTIEQWCYEHELHDPESEEIMEILLS